MNKLMSDIVETLLGRGIELILRKNKEGTKVVDLQTGAKSHGHLVEDGQKVFFEGRYGHREEIYDIQDVYLEVKWCLYGRDYMNFDWIKVLQDEKLLEVVTKTTTHLK